MEIQTFTDLTHRLQLLAITALVIIACVYLSQIRYNSHIAKLPAFHNAISSETHRKQYLKSAKRMYKEGYEKVHSILVLLSYSTDDIQVQRLGLEGNVRRWGTPSRH